MRMHPDQVDVTTSVVARLVAEQFPQWRDRRIVPVSSHGTVNRLFWMGEEYVLRFPLQPNGTSPAELIAEQEHARRVAPHVTVGVPEPVAVGRAGLGYAGPWSVFRWIDGESADRATDYDAVVLAEDLAAFVLALHRIGTGGRTWAGTGRGGPLAERDEYVRRSLSEAGLIDTVRVQHAWERCLAATPRAGPDVWIHTDLMPGNLIMRGGRLTAVIDLGEGQVGDPAVDLMPAWNLLSGPARATYRRVLDVDDADWERGRGWSIVQAVPAVAYYVKTNPSMSHLATRTLAAVVDDFD